MNVFDILKERGFIQQTTHEMELKDLLSKESVTFYIGFDPTADSLHVGHFVTIMAMRHMQLAGHRPIALMGGGTGMIGDPSGKTDMRKMMTLETINHNVECFKKQLSKFIDFDDNKAIIDDNANWLLKLNYVNLLREVGAHFSVNRMLTFDCYKQRLERGLSFLEFNYMIMQSYDFLELYRKYNCRLQLGGNDQWSNIIGGVELVRRIESDSVFGMTFSLLTNSEGTKMGKTVGGAIWLDSTKTSPYEFYQYWRNVADADVRKCLCLLTFIPMDEVNKLSSLEGAEINKAKEILAYEVTKIVHSEEEAMKAQEATRNAFSGKGAAGSLPTTDMSKAEFENGIDIVTLLVDKLKLAPSKSEARRLISQKGIRVATSVVPDTDFKVTLDLFNNDALMIQKGKKVYHQINVTTS